MHARVRNTHGAVSLQITARTVPVYVPKGVRALLEHPDPLEEVVTHWQIPWIEGDLAGARIYSNSITP